MTQSISDYLLEPFEIRDPEVERRIEHGISTYRKSDVRLRLLDRSGKPVNGTSLEIRQQSHDFLFGANIFLLGGFDAPEKNARFEEAFTEVFNSAVVPFFWSDLEPQPGKLRFAADSPKIARRPPPDVVLEFCERHQLVTKGHCLVWHQWVPKWLGDDRQKAADLIDRRLQQIAQRYGDRIPFWDVVNEPMERYLFTKIKMLPEDYVFEAFQTAEKYFPRRSKLILNEATKFSWRETHGETTGLYLLLQNLRMRGAKIDRLGLQYHYFFYDEKGQTTTVNDLVKNRDSLINPRTMLSTLDLYWKLGLPTNVSEITLPAYKDLPDGEEFQARLLRELYRLWFSHPAMEGINWWNMADGTAHGISNELRAGLLNPDLTPKPAYKVLRNLIREEWTTSIDVTSGEVFDFSAFHGNYIIATQYNGRRTEHALHVGKSNSSSFDLNVDPIAK